MKFKILLLLLLVSAGLIQAQPYRNLVFSEVRMDDHHHSYAELCNMGNIAVDLANFEVGSISPWSDPFVPGPDTYVKLPARMLNPGETFIIATVRDWVSKMSKVDPERYAPLTKPDMWRLADLQLHVSEATMSNPPVSDSVSVGSNALVTWGGGYCFYLRHHFIDPATTQPDSVVVDAVNGIFTGADGRRPHTNPSDVAGVANATANSILVRKYSVKTGSGGLDDWETNRGIDLTDSEWLPIPRFTGGYEPGRKEYWTLGSHGNFRLNAQTLKSNTITIDWVNNTMEVAWGARNMDSIMNEFDFAPGIAWAYTMSANHADSAYTSVRTGDVLTLYAAGNQLDMIDFKLTALPPTNADNRVIPKNQKGGTNWFTPFVVTDFMSGMDTIREIPFATRVDTLLKYLEKPNAASWQIVWVDGTVRPDLKYGDKLKVTAANNSTKEYFINVRNYRPSHNANLSSITWPDIPEYYKGIFGWIGDTIPDFAPTKLNYNLQIPYDVSGIPALVAKSEDPDAKIEVIRAVTLAGTAADRTIKFNVTAEDDSVFNSYSILLEKEKDFSKAQPFVAEPFISQLVFRADWRQFFIEICNPGNQPLDLSKYCIARAFDLNPANAITSNSGVDDYANRYQRYVPGYVWQDETSWAVQPSMLEKDQSVNTIIEPGGTFVIAWAYPTYKDVATRNYPDFDKINVNFKNGYNPWGIEFVEEELASYQTVTGGWYNSSYFLYKITNDSILNGLKPLNDPNDAQILDVVGRADGSNFGAIEGRTFDQNTGLKRLPHIYKGNTIPGSSFGDGSVGTSEWLYTYDAYWATRGYGWPETNSMNSDGIGSHELNPITEFMSTIFSVSYVVSDGYSMNETIVGPAPGITVDEFLMNILKADDAQELTITRGTTVLTGADQLNSGDLLTVVSANKNNTSRYIIDVSANSLDSNALLTSSLYSINVTGNQGTISGFAQGTKLKTVFEGVKAPSTASLFSAFYNNGPYAPFKTINFDSIYVDVIATDNINFEVVAQNGTTRITYKLKPNSTTADAFVLSNVYDVDQTASLIRLLPDGTNVTSFFNNLIPAPGATIKLLNNMDQIRDFGTIYKDDKLVVTSQDGTASKTYSLLLISDVRNMRMAFVYSNDYTVNQQTLRITVKGTVSVADFMASIYTSYGATAVLLNNDGSAKTGNNVEDGNIVRVTSVDGTNTRNYTIILQTSAEKFDEVSKISVFPNPTTGIINIKGVQEGNNISVFSSYGRKVANFKAGHINELISIENQPAGLYLIVIDNGTQVISKFKMIKR